MSVVREELGLLEPEAMPRLPVEADPAQPLDLSPIAIGDPLTSLTELDPYGVPPRVKVAIEYGEDPDHPKIGDNSKSVWRFDVACSLLRCGVPEDKIMAIFLDSRWGISAGVLNNRSRDPIDCAMREIRRARDAISAASSDFQLNDRSKPISNQHNIRLGVSKLAVALSHNQFSGGYVIDGLRGFGPQLNDDAMRRLWLLFEERFGFRPEKSYFWDVVFNLAHQNGFHPVRDYLLSQKWDGKPRLSSWLSDYAGADENAFNSAVGEILMIAAVRRIMHPGCKFDEMPTFEGSQGTKRSSAIAVLAGKPEWVLDNLPLGRDGRQAIEQLPGHWFVEVSELAALRNAHVEDLKAFMSRGTDCGRPAYGRTILEIPRQCIFIGTTNSDAYLKDSTGNRRYWPVKIKSFDLEALARDRDQLWAEAVHLEALGQSIRLDPTLWGDAAVLQESRRIIDPFVDVLAEKLGDATGKILGADVWKLLDIPLERQPPHAQRMGDAMRSLGWERKQLRFGGPNPQWGYARGDSRGRLEVAKFIGGEWVLSHSIPTNTFISKAA